MDSDGDFIWRQLVVSRYTRTHTEREREISLDSTASIFQRSLTPFAPVAEGWCSKSSPLMSVRGNIRVYNTRGEERRWRKEVEEQMAGKREEGEGQCRIIKAERQRSFRFGSRLIEAGAGTTWNNYETRDRLS